MRAISWFRDLMSSERGNVFVVAAAVMPLLLGSAAFAIDTIQLSVWKRQLQRAADSGAIAGAYALSLGDDEHTAVHNDLDKNAFPVLSQEEAIAVGPAFGWPRTVGVTLTADRTLPFLSIFTKSPTTMSATATAALVQDGQFCMVSLYDGPDAGIDVNGNAEVELRCGMKSNCTGAECVTAGGASSITADPIASVGGLKGDRNNFNQPTTLQPHSAPQRDPFAHLPNPTKPPEGCNGTLTEDTVFTDKAHQCFLAANVGSNRTLTVPAHVEQVTIWGGDIDFKGNVTADQVSWVMSGDNGQAGDLKINAQARLQLSSPDVGPLKGVLFYRDRRASNIEIKINGGAQSRFSGAMYFPTSDITFAGGADMDTECLQMVGQKLKFRGGSSIDNDCSRNPGAGSFNQVVVRLVG